jgi:sarcosine oxidase, subunit beta
MTAGIEKDIVIVGGGVCGSASAYYLARAGRRVLLVEKGVIAGEASGRNGGHISPTVDGAWGPIGRLTLDIWPTLSEELGYPTEYRRSGGLFAVMEDDPFEPEQLAEYRRECGFVAEALTPEECFKLLPQLNRRIKGGVHTPRNGHANPILSTKGLAKAAQDYGAEIWTHTQVTGIDVRDGAVAGVHTSRGYVSAPYVVNAAGSWAGVVGAMASVTVPVMPRRIQILLSESAAPMTEMVWSGNGIYSRQAVAGQLHFGAGGPAWDASVQYYDKAVTAPTMQRIAHKMVELMPGVAEVRILRSWAGVIGPTADGDPILGLCDKPRGLVVATGFAGNGFVTGPATGKVVSELILTGEASIDISGCRVDRFADRPDWVMAGWEEWWNSPNRTRETGAWAIEGVRAEQPT